MIIVFIFCLVFFFFFVNVLYDPGPGVLLDKEFYFWNLLELEPKTAGCLVRLGY